MKTIVIVILLIMAAAGLTWLLISSTRGVDGGFTTTTSGLMYKDVKVGRADKPSQATPSRCTILASSKTAKRSTAA